MKYHEIIAYLYANQNKDKVAFKENKFGIVAHNSLGIYHKELQALAKQIGQNSELAIQLSESNIYEARLLCSKLFKIQDLTEDLMETWVKTFENWEICDSFCLGLFAKSQFANNKIYEWAKRDAEFVKRASFATLAGYCMANKKSENKHFEPFFDVIVNASDDERLYVKKAVNWALRNLGKRNHDLKKVAIHTARLIAKHKCKSAQWIGTNALRELEKVNLRVSDYPRATYRK